MNFAKKALVTACFTLAAGNAFAQYTQPSPPSWGLDRIDQDGSIGDGKYIYDSDAAGVPVFVIDTGTDYNHPDFEGRASLFKDLVDPADTMFSDCQSGTTAAGHGTMVAGLIGGKTYGVAKKVSLKIVRAIACNGGSSALRLKDALDYIVANGPAAPNGTRGVINMSLVLPGSTVDIATLEAAVTNAVNAGFVVVAAAGNGGSDACGTTPGRMSSVVTVAGSDASDYRYTGIPASNYGACVKIFAPGGAVKGPRVGDYANTNPETRSGTSFATPHVAGAAAILLAKGVAPSQVLSQLQSNGTQGVLNNIGASSPNTLLRTYRYVPPVDSPLANGVPQSVSASAGSERFFWLDVPAGASSVTFKITGGSGDADLYVRFGDKPQQYVYDCRPYRPGNEEICTMYLPTNNTWNAGGRWWVRLYGYSTYSTSVSGTIQY
jgi:serine protease